MQRKFFQGSETNEKHQRMEKKNDNV